MPRSFRRFGLTGLALALSAGLILALPTRPGGAASAPPDDAQGSDPTWQFCRLEIAKVEQAEHIPAHLLGAIAIVESGRREPGTRAISAWPWTVMAEGRGRYLPTKDTAIKEVEKLRARGVRNIDIGCMQVNLMYHPDAFADLDEAFDPAANVAYAASFLKALRQDKGSWSKAVAHYHSATPARHIVYRTKVFAAWRDERRLALKVDYAADLARAEAAQAEQAVAAMASAVPAPPAAPEAEAEEPTLLTALAFGRAGPVDPENEPAAATGLGHASLAGATPANQLGMAPMAESETASLQPGG